MTHYGERFDVHSPAWVFQTWASFALAVGTAAAGIACLPANRWI